MDAVPAWGPVSSFRGSRRSSSRVLRRRCRDGDRSTSAGAGAGAGARSTPSLGAESSFLPFRRRRRFGRSPARSKYTFCPSRSTSATFQLAVSQAFAGDRGPVASLVHHSGCSSAHAGRSMPRMRRSMVENFKHSFRRPSLARKSVSGWYFLPVNSQWMEGQVYQYVPRAAPYRPSNPRCEVAIAPAADASTSAPPRPWSGTTAWA